MIWKLGCGYAVPETLTQIVQQIGWQNVQLDEIVSTVRFLTPSVELHLGAVGKGYIVQAAADYLRSTGVACGLLHSGNSSIVAFGSPPEAEGWTVGLPDPQVPTQQLATVTLHDYSLSTSGSLEQSVTIQGRRYSHLFDPRTGYPVEGPLSVSVLAPDAAEGDALATAFTLQGVDWTRAYCESHPDIGAIFLLSEAAETKVLCIGDRRILAWIE